MPKISVVMGLFNTPYNYLEATMKSILAQTVKDFELIIIDDASTIEYTEFFKKFSDNRIKYSKLDKNCGPGGARNIGIKQAQGEYIAIVDSDDVYFPNRLELQMDFLDKNPDISLISGGFKQSNNGKTPKIPETHEEIKVFMLFNSPFTSSAVMFRKEEFSQKNIFFPEEIRFAEDYQMWINAMFANVKMSNIKDVLMIYTRRNGQLSKEKFKTQMIIIKDLYKKILHKVGIEAQDKELDLHFNIENEKYNFMTADQIIEWFNKIIEANKTSKLFDEKRLIAKKEDVLNKFKNFKNRLFKVKIGQHNLCINKSLKISLVKRD